MIQETINQNIQRNLSKTAVKYENEILTYQQLIEQASILRSAIRKELGPKNTGIKIGLCIDKDVKLLSSVYSLIDSGFTYIPIDPVTPIERIKFIIDNCDMSLVITTDKYISIFKDILPVINLCDLPSAPDSVTTIESTARRIQVFLLRALSFNTPVSISILPLSICSGHYSGGLPWSLRLKKNAKTPGNSAI